MESSIIAAPESVVDVDNGNTRCAGIQHGEQCGNPAKHTQRLVESGDLIVVGAAGMYEARCRRCFEPGVPKQDLLEFARPTALRASGPKA